MANTRRGPWSACAAATHGVFNTDTSRILSTAALEKVVITDCIPPFCLNAEFVRDQLTVLDATKLLAEAIRRLHTGTSIVELLDSGSG